MTTEDWQAVGLTTWISAFSTLCILPPGAALAWVLARYQWPGKSILETLVALPLVLPPVATGLILLRLFGRRGWFGGWLHDALGLDVVFTWKGVAIASAVMSFPLLVRSARVAFEGVDVRLEQVARVLGAAPLRVFFSVTVPLAYRGLIAGALLAFARALGEFGATMMIAGNIPGETSTLSLSIYQSVQMGQDRHALELVVISVLIAFGAVFVSESLLRRKSR